MHNPQWFKLSIIAIVLALSACGSGDNSNEETIVTNQAPTVSIESKSVDEGSNASVAATASDNDGSISSYLWSQTSGTTVELSNVDTDIVTFTAPEVTANEEIGLSLTVTDDDGDSTVATSIVSVNQLTIPLTFKGLATDSPLTNSQISIQVTGHDTTVDATADENGLYSVDLVLDDSESNAFISIVAKGVAEQANAGLISLLGTAEQLSSMAGDDNILTQDESFAVNITNITTAQYALAKSVNNDASITTDADLETIYQSLNYNEVIKLATAIKVAIDKSGDNTSLALPEGVTDTLALAENITTAQAYVQSVQNTPEYQAAQDEIYQDENLIDTSSEWTLPDVYYFLSRGPTFRFDGSEGDKKGNHFTWENVDGVINATVTEANTRYEYPSIDGFDYQVTVEKSDVSYQLKRLSSGQNSDVILLTTTELTHYPNGERPDETQTWTTTANAVRSTVAITHSGAGVAYLPFNDENPDNPNIEALNADEFTLNSDGTGHATVLNIDFTWQVTDGSLQLTLPSENTGDVEIAKWRQLTNGLAANSFAHEYAINDEIKDEDDYIQSGTILASPMNWQADMVVGIFSYDNSSLNDPLDHFWFELRANGEADTKWSFDSNGDGILTENELTIAPGSWTINADGTLVITRVRSEDRSYTEACRYAETEGCVLYHERTWRLIGQKENAYGLFHKHDFKLTNLGAQYDDISYDNRTLYKVENAPVEVSSMPAKSSGKESTQLVNKKSISKKFTRLEPR